MYKEIKVIKKDGSSEGFEFYKIFEAVNKASERAGKGKLNKELCGKLALVMADYLQCSESLKTKYLHAVVIACLKKIGCNDIAEAYQEYRDYKTSYCREFEKLKEEADRVIYLGDNENANFDSSLISTKGSLIKGYLTKSLYKKFYLSKEEKEATKVGYIYIHDLRDMILGSINCCLFDMGNVLKNGFEMSNVRYTEPKSVLTALQVIGDITLVASAQQFGGFTIPEIDKILLPYCHKSFNNWFKKYSRFTEDARELAIEEVIKELRQGFQSLELKLNTVPSSRGDFAFTTLTFGHIPKNIPNDDRRWMYEICKAILDTRVRGHGGHRVVFPKLVFLYDSELCHDCSYNELLFNEAVRCSCQCMYPDYLSLDGGPDTSLVKSVYKKSGKITSGMGCRAYLSPWTDPSTGEYITTGRFNIGAVSLNLPLIASLGKDKFWENVDKYANMAIDFLNKRYEFLSHIKAGTNPMAFCQGGFYKGNLKPDDCIAPLLKHATASLGVTALHETSILMTGKSLTDEEGHTFAMTLLRALEGVINQRKKQDGHLYALYGTPAESLCMTQARQYSEATGDTQFGDYFTNSFHCHVSEDITPIEKQNYEYELFHNCEGGHIQYIRLDNPRNWSATKKLIELGMQKGFYQGVNFDDAVCEDCGERSTNVLWTCPHCGSSNLTVISRVCGYLGYSNINGKSRMNEGKMSEIHDRKSM